MKKKYVYKNAIVYISNADVNYKNLHKATENFFKKVFKENSKWNPRSRLEN